MPQNLMNRAVPARKSLREQLTPIPLQYDEEGRMWLLHKNKRDQDDERPTLTELIGHSPDEADAFVLAVYGQFYKAAPRRAGVIR